MSSVTRFIRQIPSSASHLNAAAVVAGAATLAFELVPSSGNIVGNYPPGYVQNSAALAAAIAAANAAASGAVLLRDMGKTILAPVAVGGVLSGTQQYYRQVQLIAPAALSLSSGFVGNFGVLGAANTPTANVDYLSFFIPVSVAGVGAAVNAYPVASGQM
jgi:hypothetical protein